MFETDSEPSRNINPLYLAMEGNLVNQTRKCCALYFEDILWEWEVGLVSGQDWSVSRSVDWARNTCVACLVIHGPRHCSCDPRFWVELVSVNGETHLRTCTYASSILNCIHHNLHVQSKLHSIDELTLQVAYLF